MAKKDEPNEVVAWVDGEFPPPVAIDLDLDPETDAMHGDGVALTLTGIGGKVILRSQTAGRMVDFLRAAASMMDGVDTFEQNYGGE